MKMRRRYKVGVRTYVLRRPHVVDPLQRDVIGRLDNVSKEIAVEASQEGIDGEHALFHELFHAAEYLSRTHLEEDQAGRLSDALFMILHENNLLQHNTRKPKRAR